MRIPRPHAVRVAGLLAAMLSWTHAMPAQSLTRPFKKWETIETASFRIHYPAEMRGWVLPVAQRMESYAAAVNQLVGNKPAARVTVLVEDPYNLPNGFAVPLLEGPVTFLWPTPATPSPSFGSYPSWGEILAVHEYGHIAHLTIPTRNPNERRLWALLPARVGPVARKSPSWVIEGYATYIEGKLTGSGRPYSAGRPAVLRQWALEGQLPTYGQLDNAAPFLGGAMRYLAGSAFIEWLAARKGEESLQAVWRRMSARQQRSFAESFRGVYGAGPDDLYGVFSTELVGKALEARRALESAGLVEGDLVQKLSRGTGDPAVSKDASMVAVVLRSPNAPSRLVIWRADEAPDSSIDRARRRMLERDPLDVAPFDSFPRPKKAVATLYAVAGRSYENPRWFADGEHVLITRDEPLGDGTFRPDLFVWNRKRGGVRRITHGSGIRQADPSPDGRSAAAVRCAGGICDLVQVDLRKGTMRTLAPGSPFVVWHRPRWSADGRRIAASVLRDGRWTISVVDVAVVATNSATTATGDGAPTAMTSPSASVAPGAGARDIDPGDGASRHSPSWTKDGKLVVVSERGGVANLELLDPETAMPKTLTRVTGAVSSPDVGSDARVWFLALHAKGYDVRRIALGASLATSAERVVTLDPRLAPAATPVPMQAASLRDYAIRPVTGPKEYGNGPRGWRVLPGMSLGPDGDMASLMIANMDPVGRFTVVAQGGYGDRGAWRGGSLAAGVRSFPVQLDLSAWYTDHAPSRQPAGTFASLDIDSRFTGGGFAARYDRDRGAWGYTLRAGGSAGQVDGNHLDGDGRTMGFGEVRARLTWTWRGLTVSPQVSAHGAQGGTGGDSWRRGLATGALSFGTTRRSLRAEGTIGTVTKAGPAEFGRDFEQFAIGGAFVPFFDQAFLSQRLSLPSVPVGYASGRRLELYRVSTRIAGFRPWAVWVAAGDSIAHYQRLLGVEREFVYDAIGFARVPATHVRFGIGYSMDEPYKEKIRPYVSVTYRP